MVKQLTLLIACLLTASCAGNVSTANVNHMSCGEMLAEIQTLETQVANRTSTSEASRAMDTGTTVAAQGASIAGVPYVGAVFSIGRTLFNHNKQSAAITAQQAEQRLSDLQYLASDKNCYLTDSEGT